MKRMWIETLDGVKVCIDLDPKAERCWILTVRGGSAWENAAEQTLFPNDDEAVNLPNGDLVIRSRSLARLMELVTEYIGTTEA